MYPMAKLNMKIQYTGIPLLVLANGMKDALAEPLYALNSPTLDDAHQG